MVDVLTLTDLTVHRRRKRLLGPVNLSLEPHGMSVVIGPNGSGKTTLLRAMHGLERLSSGALTSLVAPSEQAYVFQTPIMLRRSVQDNLTYPPAFKRLNLTKAEITKEVDKWLETIGLEDACNRPAPRLSGGEKQKLALARALICKPKLLFLDEPCANLDGRSTREIERILLAARDHGTRIILATHDMGQLRRLADDAVFMLNGRVHEHGSKDHITNAPQQPETKSFLAGEIVE